ncbi:MAG: glycosyltransferase family 4 protein [Goleter apudmare HA4340-LM2]|jgi:glycosyltransferase involved in cell wall biosynthesis|nr:glycosyltransferase family 4 protein [Goleter apudmare HA4340-LM2]
MKLKIAIVVHGRFHAFDLARELINQGHNVTLFTNYPKKFVEKFNIPQECVETFLLHGTLTRIIHQLPEILDTPNFEAFIHSAFSHWASQIIIKHDYDVVHVFSGVAEEIFSSLSGKPVLKTLLRGSAHIRTQFQLLSEEEKRTDISINKPSNWMIAREEREYQLADVVVVLSTFAQKSFITQNIPPLKIKILPLGTQLNKFRPEQPVIEERCYRILHEPKLRILMVGTFSYRKGVIYLVDIAKLCSQFCQFKFVGSITREAQELAKKSTRNIEFISKQPQFELPKIYAWADIFIFPTIEDGYAVVLAQAQAAALPILTTENCSGRDIVVEGKTGWILPIRNLESFVNRLQWCHENRQELAWIVRSVYQKFQPRDWSDVAADFANIHADLLQNKLG